MHPHGVFKHNNKRRSADPAVQAACAVAADRSASESNEEGGLSDSSIASDVSESQTVEGIPKSKITWTVVNGKSVPNPYQSKDGSLLIVNASPFDQGRYTCQAANPYGQVTEVTQLLLLDYEWKVDDLMPCSAPCGNKGTQYPRLKCLWDSLEVNRSLCRDKPKPALKPVPCNIKDCLPRWLVTPWSSCPRSCGGGMLSRKVTCNKVTAAGMSVTLPEENCGPAGKRPADMQPCNTLPCVEWATSTWVQACLQCGAIAHTQQEQALCRTRILASVVIACNLFHSILLLFWWASPYVGTRGDCKPVDPYQYQNGTEVTATVPDCTRTDPVLKSPNRYRPSTVPVPTWFRPGAKVTKLVLTNPCNGQCIGLRQATQHRQVFCQAKNGTVMTFNQCSSVPRPPSIRNCSAEACNVQWHVSSWTQCTATCGNYGFQSRRVECVHLRSGKAGREQFCSWRQRPANWQRCNILPCEKLECRDTTRYCEKVKQLKLCQLSQFKVRCCESCKDT
ncbi:UNVERIFIED_CONTAM: hypothetical protein FKN15_038270 [Acipenser sinensis]